MTEACSRLLVVQGRTFVARAAIAFTMKETLDHRWRITRYALGITYAAVLAASGDRVHEISAVRCPEGPGVTQRLNARPRSGRRSNRMPFTNASIMP